MEQNQLGGPSQAGALVRAKTRECRRVATGRIWPSRGGARPRKVCLLDDGRSGESLNH